MNTTFLNFPGFNLVSDALPEWEGEMKIHTWTEKDKYGRTVHCTQRHYRNAQGKPDKFLRKTRNFKKHLQNQIDAANVTHEGSLTSLKFSECVRTYLKEKGEGGFNTACFRRAVENLGNLYPDRKNFAAAYSLYRSKLTAGKFAKNTIKNHLIPIRSVCNYAVKTGRCGSVTVNDWEIEDGNSRERILSSGEELTLLNTLKRLDSPLLPHVCFSLVNPIRKRDIFGLTRDAIKTEILEDRIVRVVRFQARKTKKRVRSTTLVNIDTEFFRYEAKLPPDCPFLFPIVGTEGNRRYTNLQPGEWRRVIDSDKHWNTVLREAGIHDFVWHDLKHCAETYMLRQGFSYDQMRKLGIQMSSKTQAIYDNRSGAEIADSVLTRRYFVGTKRDETQRYA